MKSRMKDKVFATLDTRPRGTWWQSAEVQEQTDALFPDQAPHKLERVIIALHFLEMAGEVEHRIIPPEEETEIQEIQYALTSGGIAVRTTGLLPRLNGI